MGEIHGKFPLRFGEDTVTDIFPTDDTLNVWLRNRSMLFTMPQNMPRIHQHAIYKKPPYQPRKQNQYAASKVYKAFRHLLHCKAISIYKQKEGRTQQQAIHKRYKINRFVLVIYSAKINKLRNTRMIIWMHHIIL